MPVHSEYIESIENVWRVKSDLPFWFIKTYPTSYMAIPIRLEKVLTVS